MHIDTPRPSKQEHFDYLSCDTVDDAIRSLARAYAIDDREVYQVYLRIPATLTISTGGR
ncbi:hypothetical protein [Collimonas antrihumi]|uniref:hypothetical protein n=1 Tax=Collimonas antrihumi TaxID=1940615 RepID=UPI001B8DA118|nr:hypothetical protein [Collimonas antrihumi]